MRESERPQKPSRPPAGGVEKSKSKSSSKTSSKLSSSSSATPKASTAGSKKPSSSTAAKSSTSDPRKPLSSSATKASAPDPKKPSSSLTAPKASTTVPKKSSSSKVSSSSRPQKTSSSTSSKSRLSTKPKAEPLSSSSKLNTSSRKEGRKASEGLSLRESSKSRRNEKAQDPSSRERSRSNKPSSRRAEDSPAPSRGARKSDVGRGRTREDKSSKSQGRGKDVSSSSKTEKREHNSSSRRGVSSENVSRRSSKEPSSKPVERSSRKDGERSKDKSSREEKTTKKDVQSRETNQEKNERSRPPREKSAKNSSSRKERAVDEVREDRDSGVEGLVTQESIIGQSSKGPEVEAVEHSQNSLETMESGISISSPRDLSSDELEVEESISSKMVEVDEVAEEDMLDEDEDEAMIDDDPTLKAFMGETFPSGSNEPNDGDDQQQEEKEDDYEEDFEDYESDFEDDESGSNHEDDLDSSSSSSSSSTSSLPTSSSSEESDVETKDPNLAAVLLAMEKENNFEHLLERVYSFDDATQDERPLLSPQEEERQDMREIRVSKGISEEKQVTKPQRPKTSRTFVNFAGAKKKQEAAHISSKMNTRGRALLSMIQLDTVSIDLLTLSPVSYEAYISSFGQSNRQQVSVQTNEDALNEEVQTEEIVMRNKWTQKPVHISVGKDNELPGPEDYMGVGGDIDPVDLLNMSSQKSTSERLTSFLNSASQVMLGLLEEELFWEAAESNRANSPSSTTEGLGFSHPPITLGNSVQSLLEGRNTPFVQFCPTEPSLLLSGHGFHSLEEDMGQLKDGGLLCVWCTHEPSRPQQLLSCYSSPTSATFSPGRPSLVLAGLEDGSLAAWDLREPLQLHTLKIDIEDVKWRVRVPSFVTACDEGSEGEGSAIVSIRSITTEQDLESDTQGSFQVVTLTESGLITWWVVMYVPLTSAIIDISFGRKSASTRDVSGSVAVSPNLGASPWARMAINRAATINVANALYGDELLCNEITCHDLKMDINDPGQLYVATGSGAVAHCSRHVSRIHPKAYYPEIDIAVAFC